MKGLFMDNKLVFQDKELVKKFVLENPNYSGTIVCDFEDAEDMFCNYDSLTSIPKLDTSKVTNMRGMFNRCRSLTSIPQLDTSNVTDMRAMFCDCLSLTTIPPLDTRNVVTMNSMFGYCESLTSIPKLDTSKVTNMEKMFICCFRLTSIPQLDTRNVTNMLFMFERCYSLTIIPQLDTSNVTNMNHMFRDCTKLSELGYNTKDPESILRKISKRNFNSSSNGTLYLGEVFANDKWMDFVAYIPNSYNWSNLINEANKRWEIDPYKGNMGFLVDREESYDSDIDDGFFDGCTRPCIVTLYEYDKYDDFKQIDNN